MRLGRTYSLDGGLVESKTSTPNKCPEDEAPERVAYSGVDVEADGIIIGRRTIIIIIGRRTIKKENKRKKNNKHNNNKKKKKKKKKKK